MKRILLTVLILALGSSARAAIDPYVNLPKPLICKAGKPCGTTCIPKAKVCHKPPSIHR
jgi:hypothetical protein